MKWLYFLPLLGCILSGFQLVFGVTFAGNVMQQICIAVLSIAYCVVPYVFVKVIMDWRK